MEQKIAHYRGINEANATRVAYRSSLTMTTLKELDEIGTRHVIPRLIPLGGGKDLLMLDYIDVYLIYSVAGSVDGRYECYGSYEDE
jgi:hypothetical protein